MNYRILLLSIIATTALGLQLSTTKQYNLQITSQDNSAYNIATLSFDEETIEWKLEELKNDAENGLYCISLVDGGNDNSLLPCFNYKRLEFPLSGEELLIEATDYENVDSISLLSLLKHNPQKQPQLHLNWRKTSVVPDPMLRTVKKPAVTGPGGVKLANTDTDEPEKSFIQKYWMYIVPPLILIMLMGGGAE